MVTSFPLEDLEHLVWIRGFDAGLEPSGPYVGFCEGFVKGRVEVLEETSLGDASKALRQPRMSIQ
jgi:hypothetical protein